MDQDYFLKPSLPFEIESELAFYPKIPTYSKIIKDKFGIDAIVMINDANHPVTLLRIDMDNDNRQSLFFEISARTTKYWHRHIERAFMQALDFIEGHLSQETALGLLDNKKWVRDWYTAQERKKCE